MRGRWRIAREVGPARPPIADLTRYERRFHSQNGEDGILEAIFAAIGEGDRRFVEFGAGSSPRCNTWRLARRGWTGLWMDARPALPDAPVPVHVAFVTAENVEDLFRLHGVPERFDLLSIDIDGNDYWVWDRVVRWRPRAVVVEYNAWVGPAPSVAVRYDPAFRWRGTTYFGASLRAFDALGRRKGYVLVGCDRSGTNAFFVAREESERFVPRTVEEAYRPPRYSTTRRYPPDEREMIPV